MPTAIKRRRLESDFVLAPSFYAPLWKKQGGIFTSDDAYGHLCTAVGATWGMKGLSFPGNGSGYIDIGKPFFATDQSGTLIIWYKFNSYIASSNLVGFAIPTSAVAADVFFIYMISSTCIEITMYNHAGTLSSDLKTPASSVSFGVFQQLILTSDGSTTSAYINGVSQALTVINGANQGDWLGDVSSYATNIHFGNLRWNNAVDREIDGVISSIRYYSQRVFSAGDAMRDYQTTKWTVV